MTRDVTLFALVVLSFAILLTTHVAIASALASHRPRRRAIFAFVAAPLAPYFAFRSGMGGRAIVWIVAAITYAAALVASRMSS